MAEQVVFLEFEDEARAFVDAFSGDNRELENTTIVALSLASQLVLKSRKVPFLNTLPFFNNNSHARTLEQSEEWLKLIESHLDTGEVLYKELIFCIRSVFNYLLWLSEVIVEVVENLKPKMLCSLEGKIRVNDSNCNITSLDRFMGFMVETFAREKGLGIERIDLFEHKAGTSLHQREMDFLKEPQGAMFLSRWLKRSLQKFSRNRDILLIASRGYGMEKAVEKMSYSEKELGTENWTPMVLDFETSSGKWRNIKKLLVTLLRLKYIQKYHGKKSLNFLPVLAFSYHSKGVVSREEQIKKMLFSLADRIETEWRRRFKYRGMDLSTGICLKLRGGITNHILQLVRLESRLQSMMESIRPRVVLSPFSSGIYTVLGDLCQRRNITAILVPHGSLAPPQNRLEEIEWRRLSQGQMLAPYPYTVAQTPLAEQHAAFFGAAERTLNTGPVLFSTIDPIKGNALRQKQGLPPEVPIIVYAVAQRKRSSVRFHIFETEDEYLSAMTDLVNAVNRLGNVHLIIKLHPSSEFSEAQMRLYLPPCPQMSILHKEPFADVLAAANLLVSYISTTVEEALINRIPVMLYDKWRRYCFVKAFDCNGVHPDDWPIDAVYYTSEPGTLAVLMAHALKHAKAVSLDDRLYQPHTFRKGNWQPLQLHIQNIINTKPPKPGKQRK